MLLMNVDDQASKRIKPDNPREVTIAEWDKLNVSLVGSHSAIEFRKLSLDDPTQRCTDVSRARELAHWRPRCRSETGLVALSYTSISCFRATARRFSC
jgi:UDP-glucuronate decarboxylase